MGTNHCTLSVITQCEYNTFSKRILYQNMKPLGQSRIQQSNALSAAYTIPLISEMLAIPCSAQKRSIPSMISRTFSGFINTAVPTWISHNKFNGILPGADAA